MDECLHKCRMATVAEESCQSDTYIRDNNYAFPQSLLGRLLSVFFTFTFVVNSFSYCAQLPSYLI